MLMRAPHLEKCHWIEEFAELAAEMKNLPVKDISNEGHRIERGICCVAAQLFYSLHIFATIYEYTEHFMLEKYF